MPRWQNYLSYACYALLAAVILGYAALFYFEGKDRNALQNLEDKTAQVATKEDRASESMVLATKKRINNFSKLLQDHKKTSNFFSFLEENTHPKIWLKKVELDTASALASVSGQTANFKTLGQQILILQGHSSQVQSVDLISLSINKKGEAEFIFYIYFNPQMLQ